MTIVARKIAATPARTALETWEVIVALLAPEGDSAAYKELQDITGIVCSFIADETMKGAPIVVYGSGPRVHIYCLFDDDAITSNTANEQALAFNPTAGDWSMSLPCQADDLTWVQASLKKHSSRVTARDLETAVESEKTESNTAKAIEVDKEEFLRP